MAENVQTSNQDSLAEVSQKNPHGININDRIIYTPNQNTKLLGRVVELKEEYGSIALVVQNYKGEQFSLDAKSKEIDPLFRLKDGEKKALQFTYNELKELMNKGEFRNITFDDLKLNKKIGQKTSVLPLLEGNKTKVFVTNKQIEKDGIKKWISEPLRFQLLRTKDNNVYLHKIVYHHNLNKDSAYGHEFTSEEKKKFDTSKNFGLVKNLVNTKTGELYNAYLAFDEELNRVTQVSENKAYLDKIYGHETTEEEREALKRGEGIAIGDKYVWVDAASTKGNGITRHSLEWTQKEENKHRYPLFDQKKNDLKQDEKENKSRGKGMKI